MRKTTNTVILLTTALLLSCRKNNNIHKTANQYVVDYRLSDSVYETTWRTRTVNQSWDTSIPIDKMISIVIDSFNHYIIYTKDTLYLNTTAAKHTYIQFWGSGYQSIWLNNDSVTITHTTSGSHGGQISESYVLLGRVVK